MRAGHSRRRPPDEPCAILHVLDHSIPLQSGYTFRTRAILREQRRMGWETFHLTSPKHAAPGDPRRRSTAALLPDRLEAGVLGPHLRLLANSR